MRVHTNDFKTQIKEFGRQIDSRITFDDLSYIGVENIFSVNPILNTELLKSTMKGLNFESNVDIDLDTHFKYEFGLLINDVPEWIDFGYYYVTKKEYNEDRKTWSYTCYDELRKSMVEYTGLNTGTFPMTVRSYISDICIDLDITFANASDTFPNYDRVIEKDPYVDGDGASLGYLYRDILDELSAVVAGNICMNNDEELEIRYVNETKSINLFNKNTVLENYRLSSDGYSLYMDTNYFLTDYIEVLPNTKYTGNTVFVDLYNRIAFYDENKQYLSHNNGGNVKSFITPLNTKYVRFAKAKEQLNTFQLEIGDAIHPYEPYGLDQIDGEYLKDVNVKFAQKFGPLNTIILSRSGESDEIYRTYPDELPEEDRIAFKIIDNQIMNGNDRGDYCQEILDRLKGLEFYLNDFNSTGVLYYELLDLYNVSIDEEDDLGNITTNTYKCLMLNDEPTINQGLVERIFTDLPGKAVTDYSNMSKDDRMLSQVYIIAKKNEGEIESFVGDMLGPDGKFTKLVQKVDGIDTTVQANTDDITIIKQSIDGIQVDITKKGENLVRNTMLWNYDGWLANNFNPLASGETPPAILPGVVNVIYWYCTQTSSVYEAGTIYEYDFIDEEWKPTNYLRKDFYSTADSVVGLSIVEDKNNYLSGNKFVLEYDGTSTTEDLGFFSEQFEISPTQDTLTFQFKLKSTVNVGKVAVELMLFNDEYVNRIDMDNYLVGSYYFVIDETKDIDTYKVQIPLNSVLTVASGNSSPASLSSLWLDTSGVQNVLKKYNAETTSWEVYNTPNIIKDQNNQYYRWTIYEGGNFYRVWNDSIKIIRGQVAFMIVNDGVQYPNAIIEIGDIKAEYGAPTDWGPRQDEIYSITHKMDSIGYTIQKGENKLFLDEDELTGYFRNGKMFYINKNEVYSKVSKSEVSNVNGLVTKKIIVNGNNIYIRYIEGV